MNKEDLKIERLSRHRVPKRETTPICIRFTDEEKSALKQVANQHGAKISDVIRCSLSAVGAIPNEQQEQS